MVPAAEGADSLWDATGESKKGAAGKGWQARAGRSVCVARPLAHVILEYCWRIAWFLIHRVFCYRVESKGSE